MVDDKGRQLSQEQIEFFKNSKVRDSNGNLLTVYHGTQYNFDTFNTWGDLSYELGSHFGTKEAAVQRNPEVLKEVYLNITKPLKAPTDLGFWGTYGLLILILQEGMLKDTLTDQEYSELIYLWNSCAYFEDGEAVEDRIVYTEFDSNLINEEYCDGWTPTVIDEYLYKIEHIITSRGYDGIYYINEVEDPGSISWIALYPNQIKLVSNKKPTKSENILENKGERTMNDYVAINVIDHDNNETIFVVLVTKENADRVEIMIEDAADEYNFNIDKYNELSEIGFYEFLELVIEDLGIVVPSREVRVY